MTYQSMIIIIFLRLDWKGNKKRITWGASWAPIQVRVKPLEFFFTKVF